MVFLSETDKHGYYSVKTDDVALQVFGVSAAFQEALLLLEENEPLSMTPEFQKLLSVQLGLLKAAWMKGN